MTIDAITKRIDDFTQTYFGVATELGTDWMCFANDDLIWWTPIEMVDAAQGFLRFAACEFPLSHRISPFLLSLLHECGHILTVDDYEDADWDYYIDEVNRINSMPKGPDRDNQYYRLPQEYDATKEGVWFYETHYEICKKFEDEVMNMLKEYYKENID